MEAVPYVIPWTLLCYHSSAFLTGCHSESFVDDLFVQNRDTFLKAVKDFTGFDYYENRISL